MKFNIVRNARIFEVQKCEDSLNETRDITNAWNIIDISHSRVPGCTYNTISCVLEGGTAKAGYYENYEIEPCIQGSWNGNLNYGNQWELTIKVKSSDCNHNISFRATHGCFSEFSSLYYHIGKSLCEFLNKLILFKSLEDFETYDKLTNDDCTTDLEHTIINLSKIITLFRTYTEINPSLPITKHMRDWIESSLKKITKP